VDPAISRAYYAFLQPPHVADRRPESRSAVVQSEDHAASKGIIPIEEMECPEAHLDRVFGTSKASILFISSSFRQCVCEINRRITTTPDPWKSPRPPA